MFSQVIVRTAVLARRTPVAILSACALTLAACSPAATPAAPTAAPAAAAKPTTAAAPAAAATAGTVSCAEHASQGAGGAAIKMGADGSLTGATANFGTGMKRGLEICLKEFNDAGGYQGRKVEMPMLDDQVKPEIAVNNITRFLEQDKVIGIIGPVNSGNALAFIPKTEEAEIPVIIPISTTVGVVYVNPDGKPAVLYGEPGVKPRKYTFRTSMQDNYQVEIILGYAKSKGWDAIGLMNDTSGYGMGTKATGEKLLAQSGFKILDTETFNIGDTDMTAQLQKMKDAGVKQIIDFGLGPENSNLLRSAQKIGYNVQFSGAWGWSDPVVPQLAGKDLAEGVITVASFTIDRSAAATDFHQKLLRDYNEDIFPITSAQAYDATKMMLQALSKAGPDPAKLRDAIENLDGFQGVTAAPAKPFSADRHHSLEGKDMFAATWKGGVLVRAQ
jgi:branched-chain amino acid transport system substrate-binding protein